MARFGVVCAVLGLLALGGWLYARDWSPSREEFPTQGVSVSSADGTIEWGTLAAQGADFAYIRAASGGHFRDPAFEANWAAARAAGMRYGAVLEFSLCAKASDQATGFMTMVPRDNAALPPVIRLAFEPGCRARLGQDAVLSELNTLINLIESHAGTSVVLNVSDDFDAQYGIASGINRTLWLDRNFFPPDSEKRKWVMWTASDMRHIDGIEGPVRWDAMAR
nr:GH25 family lysozyme [Sphingomonas sp. CDS-1]